MKYPTLSEEKKLRKKGFKRVACLDEAGRGCLAGPVVAAAVILNPIREIRGKFAKIRGIKDSKKLSPKQREKFYKILVKYPAIKWGIGIVSEKVIDRINILEATKLSMKKALRNLGEKLYPIFYDRRKYSIIDFLVLDGKMKLNLPVPQKSIVKADEKVFSCAAASIIAKVTRDRLMLRYHKKYPRYRFDLHKSYGTKLHIKMLKKYGPCKIHRRSFAPVKFEIRNPKF